MCEETTQQMRWHKEGIRDSEDPDIMSHPADAEAWHALDRLDPEFARDPKCPSWFIDGDEAKTKKLVSNNIKYYA
jgi:hypothetical protein